LLVIAALLDAGFRLSAWLLPFKWVRWLATRITTLAPPTTVGIGEITAAVERSGRVVPYSNCLSQALTAHVLLTASGAEARIRIGVARGRDERVTAHAWVESGGSIVVGEEGSEGFQEASGVRQLL
jgi:hypothetical protein